jgi:hypothetical protein
MAAALMRPLTAGDHIDPEAPVDYIKPNDRLTSLERLEIYSRSYWYRLLDSLYEDFPGLRAVLGQRAFERLAKAYLTDRPFGILDDAQPGVAPGGMAAPEPHIRRRPAGLWRSI